jgi:hypothetical protein
VKSESLKIEAEGKKAAMIIEAQGIAESRLIEAKSRNEAANILQEKFARELILSGQQVEFAKNLKATSLTVIPQSGIGSFITSQSMFGKHDSHDEKQS